MSVHSSKERYLPVSEIPSGFTSLRKRIIESGIEVKGVDHKRITSYMDSLGLPYCGYSIIDAKNIPDEVEEAIRRGLIHTMFSKETQILGAYSLGMNHAVAKWDQLSFSYSLLHLESTIVHELMHSTGRYMIYQVGESQTFSSPRLGFSVFKVNEEYGTFLEEGFVDYFAERYRFQNISDGYINSLKLAAGLSPNYPSGMFKYCMLPGTANGMEVRLPLSYCYLEKNGAISFTTTSIAAYGVQLLFTANNRLEQTMLAARRDIDALREVPKEINKIKSGLYTELTRPSGHRDYGTDLSAHDFAAKLRIIQQVTNIQ